MLFSAPASGPAATERGEVPQPALAWPLLLALAAAGVALHAAAAALDWGYVRDEFYFLDSTDRLAWGYVDHPPLSIAVLAAVRAVLGDSLLALRSVPALLGAASVVLAGMLARELGGGRTAQALSALMILVWPAFLAIDSYYSLDAFDAVFWMIAMLLVLRISNGSSPRTWLALGAVCGLGLLNKWTLAGFGVGLGVGLVVTPQRRWLATRWPWLAAGIVLVLLLPHLHWQLQNDWPTLEFLRNAAGSKNAPTTPASFLRDQLIMAHPLFAPFWIGGLVVLFTAPGARRFRLAACIWWVVLGVFMTTGAAKAYYTAPVYPLLLAAGACLSEQISVSRGWRWLPAAASAWVVVAGIAGIAGAPFALPFLSPEQFIAYQRALSLSVPKQHVDDVGVVPLHFAVRLHGRAVQDAVWDVFERLSPADRARVGILTTSSDQAGALNLWGPALGLPRAVSGHDNYWLWGAGESSDDPMIVLWPRADDLGQWFEEVDRVAEFDCRYCMRDLMEQSIYLVRRPRKPLSEIWPELKSYR